MAQVKLLKLVGGLHTEHAIASDDLTVLSLTSDTIAERTAAAGVTIDGVLLKDGLVGPAYGGTGVANNAASTLTISGNFATTFTVTAPTSVTLPTTGTLVNSAVTTLSSLVSVGTITTGVWDATTITVNAGGTGIDTATAYSVICAGTTSTGAFQSLGALGASGTVLMSNGAGALPSFQAVGAAASLYTFTMAAANTVVKGDVVYKTATNDEVAIADADTVSHGTLVVGLANEGIAGGASGNIFVARGQVITAVLTAATSGTVYYLSTTGTSTNTLTTTAPTGGPALVRIGFAVNATDLLFDPLFIADTTA